MQTERKKPNFKPTRKLTIEYFIQNYPDDQIKIATTNTTVTHSSLTVLAARHSRNVRSSLGHCQYDRYRTPSGLWEDCKHPQRVWEGKATGKSKAGIWEPDTVIRNINAGCRFWRNSWPISLTARTSDALEDRSRSLSICPIRSEIYAFSMRNESSNIRNFSHWSVMLEWNSLRRLLYYLKKKEI